jgi:flagellin
MGLSINSNLASLNAQRQLTRVSSQLGKSFERLSSGLRVARASDDAAGLAISERLKASVRSINQASRNANDGISLVQTAEGGLDEINNLLNRGRELAVQASNGTLKGSDKNTLDDELQQIVDEIDRIAQKTDFNGIKLLDGTASSVTLQIGEGTTSGVDTFAVTLDGVRATHLTINSLDIGSTGNAATAITNIDAAIDAVTNLRGSFGAAQNRLSSTINYLGNASENLQAAQSRIADVDVGAETAELTRKSILQQAAVSVLAQANAQPQIALRLLQG